MKKGTLFIFTGFLFMITSCMEMSDKPHKSVDHTIESEKKKKQKNKEDTIPETRDEGQPGEGE